MKIIISHDIDHLSVKEHILKDLIVPKYFCWSILELIQKKISLRTFIKKITGLFKKNAWYNLPELLKFDKKNKVNSTFFIAVNKGKGLSYSKKQAKGAIELIRKHGFEVGCHGICFNNYEDIKKEFEIFKKLSGLNNFGIRIHYLRLNKKTPENLSRVGYLFDTTILSRTLKQKYKKGNLTELPFHIMEGNLLGPKVNYTLDEVKQKTLDILNSAEKQNKLYVGILFHQRYFSDEFPQYKNWYVWLINYCKKKRYQFVDYKNLL